MIYIIIGFMCSVLGFLFALLLKRQPKKLKLKPSQIVERTLFTIEYYPLSGKYFVKYKKYYLKTNFWTGIMQLEEDLMFAQQLNSEESCELLIKKYKEQRFKENVKIIKK